MRRLLYIGNCLSGTGKTETTIESLSNMLRLEGYVVYTASKKANKVVRLFDMLIAIINYSKHVDYVLIDTYSTSNFYYAYLSSLLCQLLRLRYLPILHGGNLPNRLQSHPRLSKTIFNNAFKNIAPSLYIKTEFESKGYSNLVYIPNSIVIENYPFKQRDLQPIKMLWVRSFSAIYNPFLAVKLLKMLQENQIPASLCMVGPDVDGSLQKTKDYAKSLQVDVRFTGKLSKPEWIALSEAYTVFINTTNYDNMPVSIIEAMALGLPIISTNVGGLPFLITETDGILVKAEDVNGFMDALKTMQTHPERVHAMVLHARSKAERFDWKVVKNLWISVLQ